MEQISLSMSKPTGHLYVFGTDLPALVDWKLYVFKSLGVSNFDKFQQVSSNKSCLNFELS
jgi:hypothetical protein